MERTESLAALLFLSLVACSAAPPKLELADDARRKPDGVAIDPTSEPPPARDKSETTKGLVTLRTPLGIDRAFATIDDFFKKVIVKDDRLDALFSKDALAIGSTPTSGGPQEGNRSLSTWWRMRFAQRDYTKLAGETIYQPNEVEIYRYGDAVESASSALVHLEALEEGDVVLRVPILTTRVGADRYFGDEMIFWLRREGDGFKIYRVLEDFTLS